LIFRTNAKRYREQNPEKAKAQVLAARAKNPEARYEANREWRKNNLERSRHNSLAGFHRRRSRYQGTWTGAEWTALKEFYGNRCLACGLTEDELRLIGRKLSADHVIPVAKGGPNVIGNIQPLCFGKGGCNNKKQAKTTDFRLLVEKRCAIEST
jgi:hypothetical protein